MRIRVLVAEDMRILRDTLVSVLNLEDDIKAAEHRCDSGDQLPNGQRALRDLLCALRSGPPWPALDVVMRA